MAGRWRPRVLAAVLCIAAGVGAATAQTVIATGVPGGSTVELILNTERMGTASADKEGVATLAMNLKAAAKKTETDVRLYADVCGNPLRKVLLIEPGITPPVVGDGCTRTEISGLYILRGSSTVVVNMADAVPVAWLRQGSAPLRWLLPLEAAAEDTPLRPSPKGFVVFSGAGLSSFRDAVPRSCGDVEDCTSDNGGALSGGAAYWFTRFLAAEIRYLRPATITVSGKGTGFTFASTFESNVMTTSAVIGVPIGPVRPYGRFGAAYHRALFHTTESTTDTTITVDEVPVVIPGGTLTLGLRTSGWGYTVGGGVEGWVRPWLAVYGEVGYDWVKGPSMDGGEISLNERLTTLYFGLRLRLGGPR